MYVSPRTEAPPATGRGRLSGRRVRPRSRGGVGGPLDDLLRVAAGPSGQGSPQALPFPPSGDGPAGTASTVSPSIQTAISPQISPTFQQVEDSPGATTAATATQYSPGGQTARTGGTRTGRPPAPAGLPSLPPRNVSGSGGLPPNPLQSPLFEDRFEWPDQAREIRELRQVTRPEGLPGWAWAVGLAVVGVGAVAALRYAQG